MRIRTLLPLATLIAMPVLAQEKAATPQRPQHELAGRNLLKNPGAEATDPAELAAWAREGTFAGKPGTMAIATYGANGLFAKGWGEKNGRGEHFFQFTATARTEVRTEPQRIDISVLKDSIDARKVVGRIVGHMGAVGNPHFKGCVVVEYLNDHGKPLQTLRTRNLPCDTQGPDWQLVRCSESGIIPPGTRTALVYLSAYFDADGSVAGSFVMDDVSFELHLR